MSRENSLPSPPRTGQQHWSEQGSFSVLFALTLTALLLVLSYTLDTGFFIRSKTRFQDLAETAVLSAARQICYRDVDEVVTEVLQGSNFEVTDDNVAVYQGFYDIHNEYDTFQRYKDFTWEQDGDFPATEAVNAVLVEIYEPVDSLTGFHNPLTLKGSAVAYMQRLSMVSGGYLKLDDGANVSFASGNLYAQNFIDIDGYENKLLPDTVKVFSFSDSITFHEFTGFSFLGSAQYDYYGKTITHRSPSDSEIKLVGDYRRSLSDLIQQFKKKADPDQIYTSRTPKNNLYGVDYNEICYFDFTDAHDSHRIVYIDLPPKPDGTMPAVILSPFPCASMTQSASPGGELECISCYANQPNNHSCSVRSAFGSAMKNMTIVSTCDISIPLYLTRTGEIVSLGGTGRDQVTIICDGTITVTPGFNALNGVNFFCNSFSMSGNRQSYTPPDPSRMRVITESGDISITGKGSQSYPEYAFDFAFSPPCPPVIPPALGRLEQGTDSE